MATNTCRLKAAGSPRHKALSLPDIDVPTCEEVETKVSQYPNVYWHIYNKKWVAKTYKNGKEIHHGCFDSDRLAHIAILEWRIKNPMPSASGRCQAAPPRGLSKFKGVCKDKERGQWSAAIMVNNKTYRLGRFPTEEEAAHAYDKKCLELRGPDARLNFPLDKP